jgi:hypothetical protein
VDSGKISGEPYGGISLFSPPAPSSIEPRGASHLGPSLDETGVAGLGSAAHELPATGDCDRQDVQQLLTVSIVKAVGVRDEPKPLRPISCMPAKPGRANFVVDRHAHEREPHDVIHRAARGRKVEVQQSDRSSVVEDGVLEAHVVVTDQGSAVGVR